MKSNPTFYRQEDDKVFLIDPDNGSMSITNDAENVVEYCLLMYGNKRIIYLDTNLEWWELLHDDKAFVGFRHYDGFAEIKQERR
jgi:hypothetical protein